MGFPPIPPEVKSIAHILKVADEHDNRNIVVSYWARMYACQSAMKLIPGKKPKEVSNLLLAIMDWLEETKKANHDVEGVTNETVAQAVIEQYAFQLFNYADGQDRAENFNKNMIKAFYTAGILMDVLEQFGEVSEEIAAKRKYAKWKAAYIHNCLKLGETPTAGGPDEHLNNVIDTTKTGPSGGGADGEEDEDDDDEDEGVRELPPDSPVSSNTGPFLPPGPTGFNAPGPAPMPSPVTPAAAPSQPPFVQPSSSTPQQPIQPSTTLISQPSGGISVNPEHIQKAQKYCKYATSALNYDDVKTAVENLHKALNLLQHGRES